MNSFWIKLTSLIIIVGTLFGYNWMINSRQQDEKITDLEIQLKEKSTDDDQTQKNDSGLYKDGTYQGEAKGFGGPIKIEAVIKDGKIKEINILSAENEDNAYLDSAKAIIDRIIDEQSYDVDTVSGATFSSTGIKNAVKEAIGKAEK